MHKFLSTIILSAAAIGASAQDMSTEITVDRTITTELPSASPMRSVWPQMADVPVSDKNLKMAEYGSAAVFSPMLAIDRPYVFSGIEPYDGKKGYLWAGYFPAYNLGAAFGYRFLNTEKAKVGVAMNFDGQSYNSSMATGENQKVRSNIFGVQLYSTLRLTDIGELGIDAQYSHAALKSPAYAGYAQPQGINRARAAAELKRHTDGISYDAGLYVRHTGTSDNILVPSAPGEYSGAVNGASETYFAAKGKVRTVMGEHAAAHMALDVDGLHSSGFEYGDGAFTETSRTTGIIGLTPGLEFRSGSFDIRLGVKLNLTLNGGNTFHIAPDVAIVNRWSSKMSIYAEFGGGERFNTLERLYQYSPFAPGFAIAGPSYTPVDARAGVRLGHFGGFTADIHAGYASVHNVPMAAVADDGLTSTFIPTDLSGWYAGLEAVYTTGRLLDAKASAKFYAKNYAAGNLAAPDRAKICLEASVTAHPIDKLDIFASYRLRACRSYYLVSPDGHSEVSMGNISDLGIGADYALTSSFGVFLHLDNLLGRKAGILPGVSTQGFHGLAGVSVRF